MIGVHLRTPQGGIKKNSSAAIVILLLAAGCAQLRWHKDGADAAALERDLEACQQLARLRAFREVSLFGRSMGRIVGVDARGAPIMTYPDQLETDRFLLEHDLARDCMREKGYELVPAKDR